MLMRVWTHQRVGKADGLLLQVIALRSIMDCIMAVQTLGSKVSECSEMQKGVHRKAKTGRLTRLVMRLSVTVLLSRC